MKNKNYQLIIYYLSSFMMVIGLIQLIPLITLFFYKEELNQAYCFLIPGIITIVLGLIIKALIKKPESMRLDKHYDSLLVVLVWILTILVSACPWILSGKYNFSQAVFEMTSGYSTTGLTVCDIANAPKIFLFFRSLTLYVGGIGLVLILTALINDRNNINIYNAEGHSDRILSSLGKSARMIFIIYTSLIILGAFAFKLAGLPTFDAINTSMAAVSTGGFSVIPENIYGYHSLAVEIIAIVLMILGATNFFVHFLFLSGHFKQVVHNDETKCMYLTILVLSLIMSVVLFKENYDGNFWTCFRVSIFQLVSCLTGTGFTSMADPKLFPNSFIALMIFAMLLGGNAESTSGGIKQYRIVILIKGIYYSIKDSLSNKKFIKSRYLQRFGKRKTLSDEDYKAVYTYILLFIFLFFLGSFIFTLYGYSLQEAMYEFSSVLSTVGMSIGITGYSANKVILWTSIIGMFLGRLEIYVVLEAFIKFGSDFKKAIVHKEK